METNLTPVAAWINLLGIDVRKAQMAQTDESMAHIMRLVERQVVFILMIIDGSSLTTLNIQTYSPILQHTQSSQLAALR